MQLAPDGAGAGTDGRRRTPQCRGEVRRTSAVCRHGDGMAIGPELVARPGAALPRGRDVLAATLAPSPWCLRALRRGFPMGFWEAGRAPLTVLRPVVGRPGHAVRWPRLPGEVVAGGRADDAPAAVSGSASPLGTTAGRHPDGAEHGGGVKLGCADHVRNDETFVASRLLESLFGERTEIERRPVPIHACRGPGSDPRVDEHRGGKILDKQAVPWRRRHEFEVKLVPKSSSFTRQSRRRASASGTRLSILPAPYTSSIVSRRLCSRAQQSMANRKRRSRALSRHPPLVPSRSMSRCAYRLETSIPMVAAVVSPRWTRGDVATRARSRSFALPLTGAPSYAVHWMALRTATFCRSCW
jgi:hypothetical protein